MKRVTRLLIIALAALCLVSCSKSFKDIRLTSCELVSASPRGLSGFDAVLNVGVDNPAPQVTLSGAYAVVKMDGKPCLYLSTADFTLKPRKEMIYQIALQGTLDSEFNPFMLLALLKEQNWELMTADVYFRGELAGGLGKQFEYTDIPLKNLLDKI